ncbi:MAG: PilZ protein [Verrucomicrobiaceae bacterium]|nr:PilZ protein [Verrucomicrobiaceae bacterium]
MSDQPQERRQFSRVVFDAWAELQQGDKSWQAAVVDVSLKGLLVREPADWQIDTAQPIHAAIRLDSSATIQMSVLARHQENGLIGFECQHIDIDSISNLRRLVELNLGDPELLERQLGALGGVH